jgi:hypothetical protein
VKNLERVAGQPFQIFFWPSRLDPDFQISFQIFYIPMFSRDSTIEYRPLYPETTSYSSTMDADSQARGVCGGCSGGVPNYKNDILINVVKEYLPQVLEAWRGVALAYQ